MKRLLVTGAAGGLGSLARRRLTDLAEILRLSDIAPLGSAAAHEELAPCDLADFAAVQALVSGCDGIVHFGGVSVERSWAEILPANIVGTYNIYEAARLQGVKRVFFASSNHAIGFYKRETRIDATDPVRPDSLYGVSKCFGEALAALGTRHQTVHDQLDGVHQEVRQKHPRCQHEHPGAQLRDVPLRTANTR